MAIWTRLLPAKMAADPALLVLFVNVVLYALCFQIQQPAQLALVRSLVDDGGKEDVREQFAWMKSMNGVAQLGGALLSGVLIDKMGFRNVLVLSFMASAISYGLVATATSVTHLYLAQIPTIFQHVVLAARAQISITMDDSERASYFGYIGAAYGCGFIIGPALGGQLAKLSLSLSATIAAVGSIVSIALALAVRPKTIPAAPTHKANADAAVAAPLSLGGSYRRIFTSPVLISLLSTKALFSFALAIFHTTFQLVADERFGLGAAGTGALMSFVGAIGMLTQAVLVKAVSSRYSEYQICVGTAISLTCCFALYSVVSGVWALGLLCIPMVAVNTIFQLVNSAQIARAAPQELKGTLVAVDMAIFSSMRIWTPAFGTFILSTFGYWSIGAVSSFSSALIVLLLAGGIAKTDALSLQNPSVKGNMHAD